MNKSRTGMVLLLILLWPCVWGMSHHKVEEGHNLVLIWNCSQLLDLSAPTMNCQFICNNTNVQMLYMDRRGKSSWDQQFSRRVRCDREALKQGRVKIDFDNLTALDSGEYFCDMYAKNSGSWKSVFFKRFNISVLPSETTTAAPTSGATPSDAETEIWRNIIIVVFLLVLLLLIFAGVVAALKSQVFKPNNNQSPTASSSNMKHHCEIKRHQVATRRFVRM